MIAVMEVTRTNIDLLLLLLYWLWPFLHATYDDKYYQLGYDIVRSGTVRRQMCIRVTRNWQLLTSYKAELVSQISQVISSD